MSGDSDVDVDVMEALVIVQLVSPGYCGRSRGSAKVTEEEPDLPEVDALVGTVLSLPLALFASLSSSSLRDPRPLSMVILDASLASLSPRLLPTRSARSALARSRSTLAADLVSCCLVQERVNLLCFAGVAGDGDGAGAGAVKGGGTGIVARS